MPDQVFRIGQYEIYKIVTGGRWQENCYIVKHVITQETVIIDPGEDAGTIKKILYTLCCKINGILLTHAHHDHIGAAEEISQVFSACCYLQKDDKRLLRQAPFYAMRFAGREIAMPRNVLFYDNVEPIHISGCRITAILTPGHTPGSVCYSFGQFIFTGDTLLFENVGRTDLPGGSTEEIVCSINKLLTTTDSNAVVFPGHGKAWSVKKAQKWWEKAQGKPTEYNRFEM